MPIPTRSQSVNKKLETSIPTRSQSVRTHQASTKVADGPVAARTRSAVSTNNGPEQGSKAIQPRGILRPAPTITNKQTDQIRTPPVSIATTKIARAASTRLPATSSTVDSKKVGHLRQASGSVESRISRSVGNHTRTVSSADTQPGKLSTSRLAKPASTSTSTPQTGFKAKVGSSSEVQVSGPGTGDVFNLRDELLQLNLVYEPSDTCLASFRKSVDDNRRMRTTKILERQQHVLKQEHLHAQASSCEALQTWLSMDSEQTGPQRLQILSATITHLESLGTALLEQFGEWLVNAMAIQDNRVSASSGELQIVHSLGDPWQCDMMRLREEVANSIRTLQELGSANQHSGLDCLLSQQKRHAQLLMEEIQVAVTLEASIIQMEKDCETQELGKVLISLEGVTATSSEPRRQRKGVWTAR